MALHNVTSGLYSQPKVRDAIEKAVADICRALGVPVPDKRGKLKKGEKKNETVAKRDPEEQPADRTARPEPKSEKKAKREEIEDEDKNDSAPQNDKGSANEETEWNGVSDDEEVNGKEEKVMSRFDDRLGSSDEEEYDTANEELDPMEITDESASEDSDSDSDSEDDIALDESESEEETSENSDEEESESDGSAVSPPPKIRKEPKKAAQTNATTTQFLPNLMGGYISGSESEASDVDVAPSARKNRRGQRARQAIWEKKFKEKAKHLEKTSGRDAGWDLKRGAVDGSERTPWKKGIKTPFEKKSGNDEAGGQHQAPSEPRRPRVPRPKDNDGPLHPSWEAKKKAKEQQQTAAYEGKRVVFD